MRRGRQTVPSWVAFFSPAHACIGRDHIVRRHIRVRSKGVLPIPLVCNGWVQKIPQYWKNLLTQKQLHPIQ